MLPADLSIVQQRQSGVRQAVGLLYKFVFHKELSQLDVRHYPLRNRTSLRAAGEVYEAEDGDGTGFFPDLFPDQPLKYRHVLHA